MKYKFAIKNYGADPNIKVYEWPTEAYAELERRLSHGIKCKVLGRHEWDNDVMEYHLNNEGKYYA